MKHRNIGRMNEFERLRHTPSQQPFFMKSQRHWASTMKRLNKKKLALAPERGTV